MVVRMCSAWPGFLMHQMSMRLSLPPPLTREAVIKYIDSIVSTTNPALLPDGSSLSGAPPPQVNPHVCNKPYNAIEDLLDRSNCHLPEAHSLFSCLRTKNNKQQCRFWYPKPLQKQTTMLEEDGNLELCTARNDSLINSFNPVQLSAWCANVDLQHCVSRHIVIEYCAKYVTKCEPRSKPLKEIYSSIVRVLNEGDKSLKAVQKLLINSVGERDYSAQETCHLLLQLPWCATFCYSCHGTMLLESLLSLALMVPAWWK